MKTYTITIDCEPSDLVEALRDVAASVEALSELITHPKEIRNENHDWTWTLDDGRKDE